MKKRITGFPLYFISKNGIITNSKGRVLTPHTNNCGHIRIGLKNNDNVIKKEYLHRLLYSTFKGDLIKGLCINHIDGNKQNNNLSNLEQVSYSENIVHALNKKQSKYTFVYKNRDNWRGSLRHNGHVYNKTFNKESEAANYIKEILQKLGLSNKYANIIE